MSPYTLTRPVSTLDRHLVRALDLDLWHVYRVSGMATQVRTDAGRIVARCARAEEAESICREHNAVVIGTRYRTTGKKP